MNIGEVKITVSVDEKIVELQKICSLIGELRNMATDPAEAEWITDQISELLGEIICEKS